MNDDILTIQEAAALVGRTARTLYTYMNQPDKATRLVPDRYIGRTPVFKPETVRAYFANRKPQGDARKMRGYYTDKQVAVALKLPVATVRARMAAGEWTPDRSDASGRALFSKATLDGLRRVAGLLNDAKVDVSVDE